MASSMLSLTCDEDSLGPFGPACAPSKREEGLAGALHLLTVMRGCR